MRFRELFEDEVIDLTRYRDSKAGAPPVKGPTVINRTGRFHDDIPCIPYEETKPVVDNINRMLRYGRVIVTYLKKGNETRVEVIRPAKTLVYLYVDDARMSMELLTEGMRTLVSLFDRYGVSILLKVAKEAGGMVQIGRIGRTGNLVLALERAGFEHFDPEMDALGDSLYLYHDGGN